MDGKSGPKAISNWIKSKGLQKLKFYCEMCQKQCRDDNGFKCHCMSESHLRQMQIFGENPDKFVEGYSQEFENAFLEHMRRSHRFSRVAATVVYNEYISDRQHIHMNATKWLSLTEFVMHLGRTGKCRVENTEKGWFMTYNVTDFETLFRGRRKAKRLKSMLGEEEKQEKEICKQIQRAASVAVPMVIETRKLREHDNNIMPGSAPEVGKNKKIAFAFVLGSSSTRPTGLKARGESSRSAVLQDAVNVETGLSNKKMNSIGGVSEQSSVLDDLMREEEEAKERRNRKSYWLCEGIVVKVVGRSWAEKGYFNNKGVVMEVLDKYTGEVELLDTTPKHLIRIHQDDLETVLPRIGGLIRIVNGSYRGFIARLLAIDTRNFCAKVQLEKCVYEGRVLPKVAYEDICKLVV